MRFSIQTLAICVLSSLIALVWALTPAHAYVTAASLSISDIAANYDKMVGTGLSSYSMRLNILCTTGACMSNPSAYIAGIEVGGIPLTVTNNGRTVSGYPTVPASEVFGVYTYANAPTVTSIVDGQSYKWPLRLNYTRFVNGSAPSMYSNFSLVPTFVAKTSLEALFYYGQQAASTTSWFDPASFGPTSAGEPVANVSSGTFTNGATSLQLSNFTNISYAIQFSVFNNLTIGSTTFLVPTEFYVRETFGVFYYDTNTLDAQGLPTIKRVPGPPGTVVSTWYITLSDFSAFTVDTAALALQQQIEAALAQWATMAAAGSGMSFYSYLMSVSCAGGGCAIAPPEFVYNNLGITANITAGGGNDFIWKIIDPNSFASLTNDPNASATAKTMAQLHAYAAAITRLNAQGNGYPSAGVTVANGLVTSLYYDFDENSRGLNSFPGAFGYTKISRADSSLPYGFENLIPFGPPTRVPAGATSKTARYTIGTSTFRPNVDFETPTDSPPNSDTIKSRSAVDRTLLIVIILVCAFVLLCIIILVVCACCRHRREERKEAAMRSQREKSATAPDDVDDQTEEGEEEEDEEGSIDDSQYQRANRNPRTPSQHHRQPYGGSSAQSARSRSLAALQSNYASPRLHEDEYDIPRFRGQEYQGQGSGRSASRHSNAASNNIAAGRPTLQYDDTADERTEDGSYAEDSEGDFRTVEEGSYNSPRGGYRSNSSGYQDNSSPRRGDNSRGTTQLNYSNGQNSSRRR